MKMQAAVLYEQGLPRPYADSRPLRIEEVDLDPPGEGEVLVKVAGAGLCHSDLSVRNDDWHVSSYPAVLGHEAIGRVVALGRAAEKHVAKGIAIGQRVGVGWNSGSCMHCAQCIGGAEKCSRSSVSTNSSGTMSGKFPSVCPTFIVAPRRYAIESSTRTAVLQCVSASIRSRASAPVNHPRSQ